MSSLRFIFVGLSLLLASCGTGKSPPVESAKPTLKDAKVVGGVGKALKGYESYLEKVPESEVTPDTIRRLADLKIKKEFDVTDSSAAAKKADGKPDAPVSAGITKMPSAQSRETAADLEKRTAAGGAIPVANGAGADLKSPAALEAIALYKKLLKDFPNYEFNEQALYQLARSYDEVGESENAIKMLERLAEKYPRSSYIEEVQFRRGEYYFVTRKFTEAEAAYKAIVAIGAKSPYFEFAQYKLGWTYYKRGMEEEAMKLFVTLLDYKVSKGDDLERPLNSFDERRIEDTYRVMNLIFANWGGPDAVKEYFGKIGKRPYEASIYKYLGDYYLEKRRYSDAAVTYQAFGKTHAFHKLSPYFDMWAINAYKQGDFPTIVIQGYKDFVAKYGLKSDYWKNFKISEFNEAIEFFKESLVDIASYYHALFRDPRLVTDIEVNFQESLRWYREFLGSFPKDKRAVTVHYHMSELLLEKNMFAQAAVEFERVAYDYPAHEKAADAGYTAIYALRKSLAVSEKADEERVLRDIVRSSLKFVDVFPRNEKAALVLSAAIEDMYELKEYKLAADTARMLLAKYVADQQIRRSAWLIFGHASFELGILKNAEEGYMSALKLTDDNDASRSDWIENLAATLYKQGENANERGDYKTAARYFLLVGKYTPTSKIRAVADFDGATALINNKDLTDAAQVVRSYRERYPDDPRAVELTKKLALAYREGGMLTLAAVEYEGLGASNKDKVFQRASLTLAAELYTQARELEKAYPIYLRYIKLFPEPLEYKLEMQDKIAAYLKTRENMSDYIVELQKIMDADARAGAARTDRTRVLGAKAALEFAEVIVKQFAEVKIVTPFAESLQKKQAAMKVAEGQLQKLLEYETDLVTAAATYYLAEMYYDFNRALVKSERPDNLKGMEKEQYELSIEEQAYLFEEKSIQVHQKNVELLGRGISNLWIERSIERLAKIVPARYAKPEESTGYVPAFENVDYAAIMSFTRSVPRSSAGAGAARAALSGKKSEIEADFDAAMMAIKIVQYEKAIKLLEKIIGQAPNNPVPYINLALVHEKMQRYELAEENLLKAIKVDPDNPVANNEYALLSRKLGKFTTARQIYEKVLAKNPNFIVAHKNLGILCDLYLKDFSCALREYGMLSSLVPADVVVKNWIADVKSR